jgi:serine O-acetyltransferase
MAIDQATLSIASAPDWRDLDSLNIVARPNDAKLLNPAFRRARLVLNAARLIPHIAVMLTAGGRWLVEADLTRWAEIFKLNKPEKPRDFILLLLTFMSFLPEFRNIFYMRVGVRAKVFSWMCRPLATLRIEPGTIGPGLFIQHGVGTLISPESIGANCWINQGVSIGYSNETDRPRIGDDVRISAGAKVFGKVTIGNGATVGPNTVVIGDVPPGATVLGVPGKIVWKSGP